MKNKKNIILSIAFLAGIVQESQTMMRRFAMIKLAPQITAGRTYAITRPLLAANPYEILGVKPADSIKKIKENYRQLVRKCHPDTGGNAADFRRVREAYETLMADGGRTSFEVMSESATSDNSEEIKKVVKKTIPIEDLLQYAKEQELNSISPLISLLEKEGKIASKEDFFRKAESILFEKLLYQMRLKIDHSFFDTFDELVKQGFQAKDFLKKNKISIIDMVINQLEECGYIKVLSISLEHKIFTIDEFTQSLMIKFRDQEPSMYALVNNLFKKCYMASHFKTCVMMYDSLVKKFLLPLKTNIKIDITVGLERVMKFELDNDVASYFYLKINHIKGIEEAFEALDLCVAASFVDYPEIFNALKQDFEQAVIKHFTASQEAGNLLLTFLQSKGVVFDNAFLQRAKTGSFIETFNNELLKLIEKNNFYQASEKTRCSYKNITAKTKKGIVDLLISRLENNQAFAMSLLAFALKNNIVTMEQLLKTEQFISSLTVPCIFRLLDECSLIEEYEYIVAMIEHMEKAGLVKKEQLIDKSTELMLAKLSGDFSNYSWRLEWYVMAVRLLLQNEIIKMDDMCSKLETTLPAKFVAMLTIKNQGSLHYENLITTLKLAINLKFITMESFLKELFNSASLTLEQKEQFKRLL